MKIFGFTHGGHDSSYSILVDGKIIIHEELERINRQKETREDVIAYYLNKYGEDSLDEFDYIAYYPHGSSNNSLGDFNWFSQKFLDLWLEEKRIENGNQGYGTPREKFKHKIIEVGHHAAHAANAFYSSNFQDALIFSIDGGGSDRTSDGNLYWSAFTVWKGSGNKVEQLHNENYPSLGLLWTNMLNEVFHLPSGGPPAGCQAGTVMGMAAYGDSSAFTQEEGEKILRYDNSGWYDLPENDQFNLAAKLQEVTEKYIVDKVKPYIEQHNIKNICFTGGVSLNCSMIGKMKSLLNVDNIFVPPVPYDAGLAMGVAQYVYHQILDNPRSADVSYKTPYLGNSYSHEQILESLTQRNTEIAFVEVDDTTVCNLLNSQKIISVFGGRSESGRRALGNRSILADPRSLEIKNLLNEKVKHRQTFRPFAPAILKEHVNDWFVEEVDSPYMSFSVQFKEEKKSIVPAVVHKDGTGRLQTVTKNSNPRFYKLLNSWYKKTGVPILLNTSFNDREPIVETPMDAINCFLKTKIDYLYFTDYNLLVYKIDEDLERSKKILEESVLEGDTQHKKLISSNPKIIVAQFYTDNVEYATIAEKINSVYCESQRYGYFVETNTEKIIKKLNGKAITWYKPQLVLEIFEKYNPEYVLFMDIDAVFMDHADRIENYISSEHDVVFTTDYSHHSKMNAGVFLIKNTNWSKYFLKKWWESSDIFKGGDCDAMNLPEESKETVGYYRNGLWHDQTCLTVLYDQNEDVRNMINIITNRKLNWRYSFDDSFILHAFGYGNIPNRSLDSVYARLFNIKAPTESLKNLAKHFPVERDYRHNLLSIYETALPRDIKTVIEIGVHDHGNELEMWNKYFPKARVIGVNKNFHVINTELSGIGLVKINLDDEDEVDSFVEKYTQIDLIIDNYTNKMKDQQWLFAKLFSCLNSGGIYIIEDLQTSIECKSPQNEWSDWGDPNKTTTLEMLNNFKTSKIIKSDYITDEQCRYLENNIESCEIYEGHPGNFTSIIKKL